MTNILTMTVPDDQIYIVITTRNHDNEKYFEYDLTINILTMTVSDYQICIVITTRNHDNDKYFNYDRTR